MASIYFVLSNCFVLIASALIADTLMAGRELWRRYLATVAGLSCLAIPILFILGHCGMLAPMPVTIVAAALATGSYWLHRSQSRTNTTKGEVRPGIHRATSGALITAIAVVTIFATDVAIRFVNGGIAFGPDDLTYHAPSAAAWFLNGNVSFNTFNYHTYYPLNSELWSLWFMLPTGNDAFCAAASVYWVVLGIAALYATVRIQGGEPYLAAIGCGLLIATPVVSRAAAAFGPADLAGCASLLAAMAFVITSAADSPPIQRVDYGYAGLLAGIALGCKVSFAIPFAMLLVYVVWSSRRSPGAIGNAILFLVAAVLLGSYWYARNWIMTGNPLFPAEVGPFLGPFDRLSVAQSRLLPRILNYPDELFTIMRAHLNWGGCTCRARHWWLPPGALGDSSTSPAGFLPGSMQSVLIQYRHGRGRVLSFYAVFGNSQ